MVEFISWAACGLVSAIYILSPLAVRNGCRFASRCQLRPAGLDELPAALAAEFRARISEFNSVGFELVGCFDCGSLASETRSYIAYFCNHSSNEFANVTAMTTPNGPASYFEFSSRFADGCCIETNTNEILPTLPTNPEIRVFRFAVQEPRTLLKIHRQLVEKYAPGLCALGEPREAEIQRYVRLIENFGPRLVRAGYLRRDDGGENYRLTWKGAFRTAWLGLWPISLFRRAIQRHGMRLELQTLQTRTEAALQKA